MRQSMGKTAGLCNAILDFIINIGAVYLAILVLEKGTHAYNKTTMAMATLFALGSVIVYFACDIYSSTVFEKLHKTLIKLIGVQFFIMCSLLILVAIVSSSSTGYYQLIFVGVMISYVALALKKIIMTKISHAIRKSERYNKTILLVGNGESAVAFKQQLKEHPHYGYSIIGCVSDNRESEFNWLGTYDDLSTVLEEHKPSEVIIALSMSEDPLIQTFAEKCDKAGIRASIIPPIVKYFKSKCQVDMVGSVPVINTRDIPLDNIANAAMKRIIDIVISLIVIVITSPIMLLTAIGVRLSSKGPIIFKQKRVGKDQKVFTLYKFRSMRVNKEQDTGWTKPTDKRKTRFGNFIRKTGVDELPQFFNVLIGNMSIVGPRPEMPTFVEQYSKTVPLYMVKHQVKPGITGLAQIYGFRGDTSIEGRIEMDLKYIENWSLFSDIKIIVSTPFKMFNRNEKYEK